jgi:hypothetical protein
MIDSKLFKHWVLTNTREDGTRTYTPKKAMSDTVREIEGEGFELKQDGTFIEYSGSDTGPSISYTGKYEIVGDTIYTHFKNHYLDSRLKIKDLDDNLLQIK